MSDYISKDAAIKAVSENDYEGYATWAIKAVPAADVAPVATVEWDSDSVAFFLKCPNCKCCVRKNKYEVFLDSGDLNFCPNCGVKTRRVREDD